MGEHSSGGTPVRPSRPVICTGARLLSFVERTATAHTRRRAQVLRRQRWGLRPRPHRRTRNRDIPGRRSQPLRLTERQSVRSGACRTLSASPMPPGHLSLRDPDPVCPLLGCQSSLLPQLPEVVGPHLCEHPILVGVDIRAVHRMVAKEVLKRHGHAHHRPRSTCTNGRTCRVRSRIRDACPQCSRGRGARGPLGVADRVMRQGGLQREGGPR